MVAPCKLCDKKGCGSYHDECESFQEYKRYVADKNKKIEERNRSYKDYIPHKTWESRCKDTHFKCHKR